MNFKKKDPNMDSQLLSDNCKMRILKHIARGKQLLSYPLLKIQFGFQPSSV